MGNEAKFTPGPWEVVDYRYGDPAAETWLGVIRGAFEILNERFQVGRVKYSSLPTEQNIANAQLIAAAPELFALVKKVASQTEHANPGFAGPCFCSRCERIRTARKVIAKALGQTEAAYASSVNASAPDPEFPSTRSDSAATA